MCILVTPVAFTLWLHDWLSSRVLWCPSAVLHDGLLPLTACAWSGYTILLFPLATATALATLVQHGTDCIRFVRCASVSQRIRVS